MTGDQWAATVLLIVCPLVIVAGLLVDGKRR
jgi:hypothetical protein